MAESKTEGDKYELLRELKKAIKNNDLKKVEELIRPSSQKSRYQGTTLRTEDLNLTTKPQSEFDPAESPLCTAVLHKNLEAVKLLIRYGARPLLSTDANARSPLHYLSRAFGDQSSLDAVILPEKDKKNCSKILDTLLENASPEIGKDATEEDKELLLNIKDSDGDTPLHRAANYNVLEVLTMLKDKGAKNNIRNNKGSTPSDLLLAMKPPQDKKQAKTYVRIFKDVIQAEGSIESGSSFIHQIAGMAVKVENFNADKETPGSFAFFVAQGGNPDVKTPDGKTPMHLALETAGDEAPNIIKMNKKVTTMLKYSGQMDLLAVDKNGNNYLHLITQVKSNSIDPIANADFATFEEAAKEMFDNVVKAANAKKTFFNVNHPNKLGEYPIHLACKNGHHDMAISLLYQLGANPNVQNAKGNTPLHEAIRTLGGAPTLAARLTPIFVELLEHSSTDLTKINNQGNNLFHMLTCIDSDVKNRSDLGLPSYSDASDTEKKTLDGYSEICDNAILGNITRIIDRLKQTSKASTVAELLNQPNNEGLTPLHLACIHGHIDIAEKLVNNGANILIKDQRGKTALEYLSPNQLSTTRKNREDLATLFAPSEESQEPEIEALNKALRQQEQASLWTTEPSTTVTIPQQQETTTETKVNESKEKEREKEQENQIPKSHAEKKGTGKS